MPAVVASGRRGRGSASSSRPQRVCDPCYKRKVSCDLVRPTCGACARFQRAHQEHRCSYSIYAVPSEPRPPPTRFHPQDYLPRFRSGARALEALLKATGGTTAEGESEPQRETESGSPEATTSEEPSGDLTDRMAWTSLSPPSPPGERRFELPPAVEQVGFRPRVFPTFPQTLPTKHSPLLENNAHSDPRILQNNAHSDPGAPPSHSHYHLPSTTSSLLPLVPPLHYPGASYRGASYSGDLQNAYDDPVAEEEEEDASATAFDTLASPAEPCVSPRDIVPGPSYSTPEYRFPPHQGCPPVAPYGEALSLYLAPTPEESAQAANAIAGPAYPRRFRLPDPFVPRYARDIGPAPVEHLGGGSESFDEAVMPLHFLGRHSWP